MRLAPLKQLLRECAQHVAPACDDFFAEIRPLLRRIAVRIAQQYKRIGDVDDLLQEMLLKIVSAKAALADSLPEEDSAARAYLAAMGANAVRDLFRAKGQRLQIESLGDRMQEMQQLTGSAPDILRDVLFDQIEAMLSPGRETTLFRLYYRQGFSVPEMASIPALGLTTKAAESIILRMCRRLKQRIEWNANVETS